MIELLLFVLGLIIGWNVHDFFIANRVRKFVRALREEQEDVQESTLALTIEKQGESVLVYNKESGAFLVQVKSKEEFTEYCKNNFDGKIIFMRKDDLDILEKL